MADAHVDPVDVLRDLGLDSLESVEPVTGGADTSIWKVMWQGRPYALRLFRAGEDDRCRMEQLVHELSSAAGLPVPAVERAGARNSRSALLLHWCDGQPLLSAMLERGRDAYKLGVAFGRAHAAIHEARILIPPGPLSRDWIGWAGPEERAIQDRLRAMHLRRDALLHLDYHPLNVMIDGDRITGVLDWANARTGDPRADVARTVTILRLSPVPAERHNGPLELGRRVLEEGWKDGYRTVAGPLEDMAVFYAWAGAVMIHDLEGHRARGAVWLDENDLTPIRAWTEQWKRRAGC